MIEYICAYCGKAVQVRIPSLAQKFCSKSCSAKWGNELRYGKKEVETKVSKTKVCEPKLPEPSECVFQPESIMCDRRICSRCGWNPEVAKARLEAFLEKEE